MPVTPIATIANSLIMHKHPITVPITNEEGVAV